MPMSTASAGKAAESQWREQNKQEMLKSGNYIQKEVKIEVANLESSLRVLRGKYGEKTPNDLRGPGLVRDASSLFNFFSGLRSRIESMIKRDMAAEKRLQHLFGFGAKNYGINMARLDVIKKKQIRIIAELDQLVAYWERVKNTGDLPFAPFFNRKPIMKPLKHITDEELGLVAGIDKEMRAIIEQKMEKVA